MAFELNYVPLIAAIRLKVELAEKGLPEVVNKAMKDVALRSIRFTPAVPGAVISAALRQYVDTRFASKTGRKLKRPKVTYAANDAAVAIMVARLRKKGALGNLTGAEIRQLALDMASGRVRSSGFLKAGLLAAAQPFGAAGSVGADDVHLYRAQGEGILATPDRLIAEIHNDVPVAHWNDAGGGAAAYAAAERAMQAGLDSTEADLLVYVDRKLREAGFDA